MLVILRENVENVGRIGDVVSVSEGFARNFLLPKKLVAIADEGNQKMIANQKRALEKKRQAARATSEGIAKAMGEVKVTLARKVGEGDKLFGSVTSNDIADALKKDGHKIEKRMIVLEQPIKTLGVHDVTLRLDADITADIKVWVIKE